MTDSGLVGAEDGDAEVAAPGCGPGASLYLVTAPPDMVGQRIDKALAAAAPELSRARLQALIAEGRVAAGAIPVLDPAAKAVAGLEYRICIPAPTDAVPRPQAIPLDVLYEDGDLIVVDKPAGMAAHPAPGTPDHTLVNALLHHCAGSLSGIGGVIRPGIVHRLDKDTSGVMVAAKTDAAHHGLSALFARHDIERQYLALTRGALDPLAGTIATRIGRAPWDRQKMAVVKTGGREALTRYEVERRFRALAARPGRAGADADGFAKPVAARVRCTLETGRTHQIRVHLAHRGAPCLGDAVYGSSPAAQTLRESVSRSGLARQALHAAVLGFIHPVKGDPLRFETSPPEDMAALETDLATRYLSY